MNKKYNKIIIPICLILLMASSLILTFFSKNSISKSQDGSLVAFNEIIHTPENYRILNFDSWTEGMSRSSLYAVENSDACVTQEDSIIVDEITYILNKKNFTPILKDEFDMNYSDSNDKVKFWISTSVDYEASRKDFYPYNIFIHKDLSLYVVTEKLGDYRYLKSTLTKDEYKLIEDSYNSL